MKRPLIQDTITVKEFVIDQYNNQNMCITLKSNKRFFVSYGDIIATATPKGKITLDVNNWDKTPTTGRFRNRFLSFNNEYQNFAMVKEKIEDGTYKLKELTDTIKDFEVDILHSDVFIVKLKNGRAFLIAFGELLAVKSNKGKITLDKNYMHCTSTMCTYRNLFLSNPTFKATWGNTKEMVIDGTYKIEDLNS